MDRQYREKDVDMEKIKRDFADKTLEELEEELLKFKEEFKKKHRENQTK